VYSTTSTVIPGKPPKRFIEGKTYRAMCPYKYPMQVRYNSLISPLNPINVWYSCAMAWKRFGASIGVDLEVYGKSIT
jgi:hypothetical protein